MRLAAQFFLLPILLLSRVLGFLSPRALGVLGKAFGDTLRILGFRDRIVTENLELALGGELTAAQLSVLRRDVFRHVGTLFLEIARNFTLGGEQKKRELRVSRGNMERIAKIMAPGKGAVFISGHIANWELFATGMAAWGVPVSIVAKRMNNALAQVVLERQRTRNKVELIYTGGALEQMREHLSRGRGVGFMVDQNTTGKRGIRANFFGVPASCSRGLAKLAKETGVAIVPICGYRLPDGNHELFMMDPLPYLEATDLPEGSAERLAREEWLNTQQYQSAVEALIRRHPEQWLWIHRRWKASREPLPAGAEHWENMITQ